MSIKTKIRSLIAAANTKTGNHYADLTTAVQSLIDGYGVAVERISFTINDGGSNSETFSVVSGTTWEEWVGSVRLIFNNSLELYIYGGVVATEAGVNALSLDGSTAVDGSDEIVSGATYTIISYGG